MPKALRRAKRKEADANGRDVLADLRSKGVATFLEKQKISYPFNVVSLEKNPLAEPGEELYEKFLQSWCETDMQVSPWSIGVIGVFVKLIFVW